jgi:hypothetical protein
LTTPRAALLPAATTKAQINRGLSLWLDEKPGSGQFTDILWMEAMSNAVGPGDLVLCVNVAPNHATGRPVPLRAGETYRVVAVMEFACPCGRSDALLDVGVDFAWCQTRFRLLPKPRAETKTRRVSAPKEKETVR